MRLGLPSRLCFVAGLVTACAPDAWRSDPGFDAWTKRITQECYPRSIGGAQFTALFSQPSFLDLTSRLYSRQIGVPQYTSAINGFYPGDNKAAIDCLVSKLPPLVSPTMR